jgi:hypothetical protein
MEKYLLAVDLDGTLIKSDLSISTYTKEFIKKFVTMGNDVIINTGRPHQSAVKFLKELDIHQPLIVNNGGAIVNYDENYQNIVSYHLFNMDLPLFIDFLKDVKPFLNNATVTSLFDFYTYAFDKCPFWVLHQDEKIAFHEGAIENILNTLPIRAEFYVHHQYLDEFKNILSLKKYQDYFQFIYWGEFDGIDSFEISAKNGDKGSALSFLCEKLRIQMDHVYAFGDQLNDISLIQCTPHGIAMINGNEVLKSLSGDITKYDNEHDGVVLYLQEHLFNN